MFKCPICNKVVKDEAELVECVTACANKAEIKKREEAEKAKTAAKDNISSIYAKLTNDINNFKRDYNVDVEVYFNSKTHKSSLSFIKNIEKIDKSKVRPVLKEKSQEELDKAIEEFAKEFASIFDI